MFFVFVFFFGMFRTGSKTQSSFGGNGVVLGMMNGNGDSLVFRDKFTNVCFGGGCVKYFDNCDLTASVKSLVSSSLRFE